MSAIERFDRDFAELVSELAEPRFPEYFDDVLARATSVKQRPAWTFPERWFPMGVLARSAPFGPALPWRTIALIALLLALLMATVIIGVGALLQQQRPAPPFGVAANGLLAYSHQGDLYVRDQATGESRLLVGGDANDVAPEFSPDGMSITFVRVISNEPEVGQIMLINADGSGLRTLIGPEEVGAIAWFELSPQADQLVFANSAEGVPDISVLDLETGVRTPIEVPVTATEFKWTTDGKGLIFRGEGEPTASSSALYYIGVDGTGFRRLTDLRPGEGQFMAPFAISHDGTYFGYSSFRDGALYVHVLDLESEQVTRWLPPIGVGMATGWPAFSPDNELIAYVNYSQPTSTEISAQVMVGPIDGGTAAAKPVGPQVRIPQLTRGLAVQFSPDGKSLLIASDAGEVWLADAQTLEYEEIPWDKDEHVVSWQRRTP